MVQFFQYNEKFLFLLAYRTEKGQPWVLPVVRTAEKDLANDDALNKEYLPVLGLDAFSSAATKMLLGDDSPAIVENRVSLLVDQLFQ